MDYLPRDIAEEKKQTGADGRCQQSAKNGSRLMGHLIITSFVQEVLGIRLEIGSKMWGYNWISTNTKGVKNGEKIIKLKEPLYVLNMENNISTINSEQQKKYARIVRSNHKSN